MNLAESVEALAFLRTEAYPQGIIIADDLGVHAQCDINSNCPEAIKMRKYMTEAGVSLTDLIDGYNNSIERPSRPAEVPPMPAHSGKATIQVAGQIFEVDLTPQIDQQLRVATGDGVARMQRDHERLINLGDSLYSNYQRAITEARKTRQLPQVMHPIKDMIKYRVIITMDSNGNYVYMFPHRYEPDSIVSDGYRYELSEADKRRIHQDIFVVFYITRAKKILRPIMLDAAGNMFSHYHGNRNGECWGHVQLPTTWNGSLKTLGDIAYSLKAAVCTINRNSILNGHPVDMPPIDTLFRRSTKLGKEGVRSKKSPREINFEELTEEQAIEILNEHDPPPIRRWGQR